MKHKKYFNQFKKFVSENKIIFIITIVFLILNLHNLRNWYFSAIGDEYAHFDYAKSIAIGGYLPNIFSEKGVYGVIPALSSYYQAIIMKIFGINVFGWKASHILLTSTTILALYFLCKKILNKQIATLSASFYASNHLLWAYIHTGYSQTEALFPFIFSLLAFVYRRFFLCGIFAALGFYTFYTSRVTIFIVLAWLFITYRKTELKKSLLSLLAGFGILILPFLFINKDFIIQDMLKRTLIAQSDPSAYGPWYKFIFDNVIRNGLAPWYNINTWHYVSGSIVDYLTGFFLIIGLVQTLKSVKRLPAISTKLLMVYIIPFLAVAVFSPYANTAISRLHILIPAYSIFAGIGAFQLSKLIKQVHLRNIMFFFVIVIVLLLNINRFFIETPKTTESTIEAVTIKALIASCNNFSFPIVVGRYTKPLLAPAIRAYDIRAELVDYTEEIKTFDLKKSNCIVFMQPEDQKRILNLDKQEKLKYFQEEIEDYSGRKKVIVLKKKFISM